MKILITGGNNAKTLKLLKAFPGHFMLLADYGDVPGILTEHYGFASLGVLNKDSIAHILLNFCITESIDSIIPLHDYEIEPLAKSAVLFGEYGIQVLLPSLEKLGDYNHAEKVKYTDFAVFINGELIFTTNETLPANQEADLNGVFGFNSDTTNFKLFTI
ncbi:hypothetical protein [Pedobacter punctiformis]|uniref:Thiamine pyrophosphokinase n=1 Tax=Pedobacter punctiformis TaxID=3004097 RepID=A0ABT4L8U0_9SPHI|nr:hypothetical protein [Pedobacter sp. HCMS5-2]MCZ4244326.1 hypothetical protein [Pedobacter sp. HCMS5-2]